MFKRNGLHHTEELARYFNSQFIRGPKQNAEGSFILFLSKEAFSSDRIPKLSLKEWLIDKWLYSAPQKFLKKSFIGAE